MARCHALEQEFFRNLLGGIGRKVYFKMRTQPSALQPALIQFSTPHVTFQRATAQVILSV